jgi:dienelactone hydrolase
MISRRGLLWLGAGKLFAVEAPANCYAGRRVDSKVLPGFEEFPFLCDSRRRTVFVSKSQGPPVLLMHEINGLSPGCVTLAGLLAQRGFRIYMPLLFGKPEEDDAVKGALQSCWSSQFNCTAANRGSPILTWLRGLIRHGIFADGAEGGGLGVVGMCLTGSFPISLMSEPQVEAVVLSQPALPLVGDHSEIDVTPEDIKFAQGRSDVRMLLLRFACDEISTAARMDRLKADFPRLDTYIVPCFHGLKAVAHAQHAVLTSGQKLNPPEFRKALERVVATLGH